jgi:S1-C subfamily serine protease
MSYSLAQEIGSSVTYGWRIATVVAGGPSDGKLNPDDIIVALNGTAIRNNDDLASYLEERTLPDEILTITAYRGSQTTDVDVVLGTRPAPAA